MPGYLPNCDRNAETNRTTDKVVGDLSHTLFLFKHYFTRYKLPSDVQLARTNKQIEPARPRSSRADAGTFYKSNRRLLAFCLPYAGINGVDDRLTTPRSISLKLHSVSLRS